jgi:copper chaperone CopZ
MSSQKSMLAAGGGVALAAACSACCWLPLLLIGIGFSAIGAAAFFETYRWFFLAGAIPLLGIGFYLSYFRKEPCETDGSCERPNPTLRRINRVVLWIATVLVVALALFPAYVGYLFGSPETLGASSDSSPIGEIILPVEGMTCSGCETNVQQMLSEVPGVLGTDVSYADGRAIVKIDPTAPPSMLALTAAVEKAGYHVASTRASGATRAAGHWKGMIISDDEKVEASFHVALLDGERWVGEIDVPSEGLVDYPLEVTVEGDSLTMRIGNAYVLGVVSEDGKSFSGTAWLGDDEVPVALDRVGDPEFSETFLELERAAAEPDAVGELSDDASELRQRFNRDVDKVRLVMLLAPS